ncbi:unnamed protein product [Ixodes persulcatus]
MTLYGAALPYMGSVTRGAGTATVLTITFQFWLLYNKFTLDNHPQRIAVTLNNCPVNQIALALQTSNGSFVSTTNVSQDVFILLRLSSYWSNSISAMVTILIGLAISVLTGGLRNHSKVLHLTSDVFLKLWRLMNLISPAENTRQPESEFHMGGENLSGLNYEELLKLTKETEV